MRRSRGPNLLGILIIVLLLGVAIGSCQSNSKADEIWPGLNRDGDNTNSSPTSIGDRPLIAWDFIYKDFPLCKLDNREFYGRRSHHLCIRDGEILLLTPKYDLDVPLYGKGTPPAMARPFVEHISVSSGSVVKRYLAPLSNPTVSVTNVGIQDTDMRTGQIFMYWASDDNVYASTAGDWAYRAAFKAGTGEVVKETITKPASNSSGYFVMHDKAPGMFMVGGTNTHRSCTEITSAKQGFVADYTPKKYSGTATILDSRRLYITPPFSQNRSEYLGHTFQAKDSTGVNKTSIVVDYDGESGLITVNKDTTLSATGACTITSNVGSWWSAQAKIQKHYSAGLLNGTRSYTFTNYTYANGDEGYGYCIGQFDLSGRKTNVITGELNLAAKQLGKYAENPTRSYLGFGNHHASGAPRAICLNSAGDLCFWSFTTKGTPAGPGLVFAKDSTNPQLPDTLKPFTLTILDGNTLLEKANVSSNWVKGGTSSWVQYRQLAPQIATVGDYVVIFQPAQSECGVTQARLFCFDTLRGTLVWNYIYPTGQFLTDTRTQSLYNGWSLEQAVQMTVAGNHVLVAEPYFDTKLKIRLYRHKISSGAIEPEDLRWETNETDVDPRTIALRELCAVDGNLLFLVDYKNKDVQNGTAIVRGKTNQWIGAIRGQ